MRSDCRLAFVHGCGPCASNAAMTASAASSGSSVSSIRSMSPGEIFRSPSTRALQPAHEAGPVVPAEEDHGELVDLAGLDQRERLEQLVERAEAAGKDDERVRVLDEHRLPHEEVAEVHDACRRTGWPPARTAARCCSRSSARRQACAPLLAASMMPGPAPVMMSKPASASSRAVSCAAWYIGSSGPVRAEPKNATPFSTVASMSNPSMNSPMMRITRHGSVCVKSSWRAIRLLEELLVFGQRDRVANRRVDGAMRAARARRRALRRWRAAGQQVPFFGALLEPSSARFSASARRSGSMRERLLDRARERLRTVRLIVCVSNGAVSFHRLVRIRWDSYPRDTSVGRFS